MPRASAVYRPSASIPDDVRKQRVERLGYALRSAATLPRDIEFKVSAQASIGAWAWPDGRIEVSRTLVDLLDDAELSAALAHEIAHLGDGSSGRRTQAALAQHPENESIEHGADRMGCMLLARVGVPPAAMIDMLRAVAMGLRDPTALDGRIRAAADACGPP